MKKLALVLPFLGMVLVSTTWAQSGGDSNYKPRRINKAIELLQNGQPIYDVSVQGLGYEEGVEMAQTHNDFIQYQMEHGEFNPSRLRRFMQGLVDGGPTKTGHRTPTVIVTLPVLGLDAATVRANHWVIEQVLSAGVHGLVLCHARTPGAVKALISTARYPFDRPGLEDDMIPEGLRGSGSQSFAAKIWGLSNTEYIEAADPWPLNPNGELLLALKIEDKHALANAEQIAVIPGIGYAEWGPGDQAMSLMGLDYLKQRGQAERAGRSARPDATGLPPLPDPTLRAARARVFNALKANKVAFLHGGNIDNIEQLIKAGVMVTHGSSEELATKGRRLTKREMPY